MIAVVQRVESAECRVDGEVAGSIGKGLFVLLGVVEGDTEEDAEWLAGKLSGLRVFADAEGKMNLDAEAAGGAFLVVPNFTLPADTTKGNRPSFNRAAGPDKAERLYLRVAELLETGGHTVATGEFGAMMTIDAANDGPVTVIIDSEER